MTPSCLLFAAIAIGSIPFSLAAIYEHVTDLPKTSYDYIIIGAGAAGCAVANRLSENHKFSVLLLEAGGLTSNDINSQVPAYSSKAVASRLNWNFTTTPNIGTNNRTLAFPRGRGLGGSTAINGMVYTRGSKEDYDRYARTAGDDGWSWNNLQPYFRKNEKWSEPADKHNTTGQFDPRIHSRTGVNSVSLAGYKRAYNDVIIEAIHEQNDSSPFKFKLDYNNGNPSGMGYLQLTITDKGRRSSAALSYLADEYVARPNFDILIDARVTRVLPIPSSKNKPLQFGTVEFLHGTTTLHYISSSKEIILSAGAVMSPHILLHSGIGPSTELSAVGVKPIHDLPDVGKHLSDQVIAPLSWSPNSPDNEPVPPPTEAELLKQWKTGHGPLTTGYITHVGYSRVGDPKSIISQYGLEEDPAAGEESPHLEFLMFTGTFQKSNISSANALGMGVILLTPTSRGSITINSTNPLDSPIIDLNLLATPFDMGALRTSVRLAYKFLSSPALVGFSPEIALDIDDDAALDRYLRANAASAYHPVGTTRMSRKGSPGVVDNDLCVKGVLGLRVVDAGVLPFVPAGHTQAASYVIGEKGADFIKAAWA